MESLLTKILAAHIVADRTGQFIDELVDMYALAAAIRCELSQAALDAAQASVDAYLSSIEGE